MLKTLRLRNFTAFPEADLEFGKHLNVIVQDRGCD
jgi:DNA repair ATPase RecN